MIRVVAGSRLHFGLLHVPTVGEPVGLRHFGGLGMMIREPAIALTVEVEELGHNLTPSRTK